MIIVRNVFRLKFGKARDKDWQANYQKFVPLVESGHREIFTIVE